MEAQFDSSRHLSTALFYAVVFLSLFLLAHVITQKTFLTLFQL